MFVCVHAPSKLIILRTFQLTRRVTTHKEGQRVHITSTNVGLCVFVNIMHTLFYVAHVHMGMNLRLLAFNISAKLPENSV